MAHISVMLAITKKAFATLCLMVYNLVRPRLDLGFGIVSNAIISYLYLLFDVVGYRLQQLHIVLNNDLIK